MVTLLLIVQLTSAGAEGREALRQGNHVLATTLLTEAVRELEHSGNNLRLAIAINDLAEAYRGVARFTEAEPLHKRALALLRKEKAAPFEFLVVLSNLGDLYRASGQYRRAALCYEEALDTAKKTIPKNDPLMARILNSLGGIRFMEGDIGTAKKYLERALQLREAAFGPNNLDVAETLNNLGVIRKYEKQYEKAEATFQRALKMTEEMGGPNHAYMAIALHNLGLLYHQSKRNAEAEKALRRALDVSTANFVHDHPANASILLGLAAVLMDERRFVEAEELLRKSIAIRDRNPRAMDSEDMMTFERYAQALRFNGRTADADAIEAKANLIRSYLKNTIR